jgi:hypothetical protein
VKVYAALDAQMDGVNAIFGLLPHGIPSLSYFCTHLQYNLRNRTLQTKFLQDIRESLLYSPLWVVLLRRISSIGNANPAKETEAGEVFGSSFLVKRHSVATEESVRSGSIRFVLERNEMPTND